jgi:hypothetical protein
MRRSRPTKRHIRLASSVDTSCAALVRKHLRDTPQRTLPMQPGECVREDHGYRCLGKTKLLLSAKPLADVRRLSVPQHFAHQLLRPLRTDDQQAEVTVLDRDTLTPVIRLILCHGCS